MLPGGLEQDPPAPALEDLELPEAPTGVAIAGDHSLYATTTTSVYRIRRDP
jgi:hypothetical protein